MVAFRRGFRSCDTRSLGRGIGEMNDKTRFHVLFIKSIFFIFFNFFWLFCYFEISVGFIIWFARLLFSLSCWMLMYRLLFRSVLQRE